MEKLQLKQSLLACKDHVDREWLQKHSALFVEEHMAKLSQNLLDFHKNGVRDTQPLPHFHVECTPPLSQAFIDFQDALSALQKTQFATTTSNLALLGSCLQKAGCMKILMLLGQRHTPASITDYTAIPPTTELLMSSAFMEGKQGLTIAARAWTKHVGRSDDNFWGEVKGSAQTKNNNARQIVLSILQNTTWWNIFYHYKHALVYEARVSSGHGVRWGKKGEEFIGFLEPFLEEEKNGDNF
ncbi:hypothetical protein [Candidatus Uabimicrobium amorphum]|uniref:Uncharacterized protein n=1 Tax=Uabimicrobium amorphum TaxID=2596890 RepID=A0A5S9ILB1_UABAM|nr:hypothetical protein [Candidatus Uabimicrobium amorphum]BBM83814.1 hypothetical protein UABAM_02169 [Candidatus Uabimicrobium amorphum]